MISFFTGLGCGLLAMFIYQNRARVITLLATFKKKPDA